VLRDERDDRDLDPVPWRREVFILESRFEGSRGATGAFHANGCVSLYVSILKNADPMALPRVTELRKINRINEEILRKARSRI